MEIEWTKITPTGFEELCYQVLEKEGFVNLDWIGKRGSDRGRDIICNKIEYPLRGVVKIETYMAQCKRYTTDPPSKTDLDNSLTWAKAHKPDVVLIMVSNTLSSGTQDWLEMFKENAPFDILVFDEKKFETFFEVNKEIYINFFQIPEGYEYNQIEEMKADIIHVLGDTNSKSVSELSDLISIDDDLLESLNVLLEKENIIEKAEEQVIIRNDVDAFLKASKYMLSSKYKYVYLLSEYVNKMINIELIRILLKRYQLNFSDDEAKIISNLISLSPTCLYDLITENVSQYEVMIQQMKELKYDEKQKEKWNSIGVNNIIFNFVLTFLIDKKNPEGNALIRKKGVRGYRTNIDIKLASQNKFLFGINTDSVIMFQRAGGPIKAGQLVTATTPHVFIESAQIFANLELYEQAISDMDMAIKGFKGTIDEKNAWNNKGVFYERWGKIPEAKKCYEESLKIDPEFDVALKNLNRLADK
ncbi:restriction endonuclease [Candidatus Bathyarchaeota archaeon]|nr:restriction endonuclease [Candidatus Bathyarchaeota archaeon]